MSWREQRVAPSSYLVTLRHSSKMVFVAPVPNAELPGAGETFRGNASLCLGGPKAAFIGKDTVYGIDTNKFVNKLEWKRVCATEGHNHPHIHQQYR